VRSRGRGGGARAPGAQLRRLGQHLLPLSRPGGGG
jgi:hypothetical protein